MASSVEFYDAEKVDELLGGKVGNTALASEQTFDLATENGMAAAIAAVVRAMGGTVVNE